MDIQQQFNELVEGGMSPEEAIQQLKAEYEKLLSEGQIDEATLQDLLKQLEGLNAEPQAEMPVDQPQEEDMGEPEAEMPEAAPAPIQEQEQPMAQEQAAPVDDTDPFADRAQQLLDSGEFEDFDEAYDYAMDEENGEQDEQTMLMDMIQKFLTNEIDEAKVLEMLKTLKMAKGGAMAQRAEAPKENL
jgi:hypothetical protein